MYRWRKMTEQQRRETAKERRLLGRPRHSPRHHGDGNGVFLITSTCFEHRPHIGRSAERMSEFRDGLLSSVEAMVTSLDAWVVLPNHYHILLSTRCCPDVLRALGRLHGKTSRNWNLAEHTTGRKVWFNTLDRKIEGDRHHITALHYVLHNPVKHGHVKKWDEWEWSSAREYLEAIGREEAERRWREYPLLDFGAGWDD